MLLLLLEEIDALAGQCRQASSLCMDGQSRRMFYDAATGKLTRIDSKPLMLEARRSGHAIHDSWVPIEHKPDTVTLDRKLGITCKRKQFPLVQASAITVHKSQGGTYSSVVYEYGRTHTRKLVYVALSRCTNLNNLHLTNAKGVP